MLPGWNDPYTAARFARFLDDWTWKWALIVAISALLVGAIPRFLFPRYVKRANQLLQLPRTITSEQKFALRQYFARPESAIPNSRPIVDIDYVAGDQETEAYARQLQVALTEAGAHVDGPHAGTSESVRGLRIAVKSETEMPEAARVLYGAFQFAKIHARFEYYPHFEPAHLAWEVRVGPREAYKDLE